MLFCLVLPAVEENPVDKTPVIEHDFGQVTENENPQFSYTVGNKTSSAFKIVQIRVPCGCAATKLDKDVLAPGESTTFGVTFYTSGMLGKISKSIYVVTDSKEMKLIQYLMKADIRPRSCPVFSAFPSADAGKMKPGASKNVTVRIENRGAQELKVEGSSGDKSLELPADKLPLSIAPCGNADLVVVFTVPDREGQARATLALKTNDPRRPEALILFTADVAK